MNRTRDYKYFRTGLLSWHENIDRELPWKNTRDPYKIWISEIILQQTRVEQGMGYYLRFIERFPTIKSLAKASEDDVLALWKGLGYYARARNLHAAAKEVASRHNGIFPGTHSEILKLKGIGPYTAAAIASFAFDKAHAVVDGNVYRVLSRVFGISLPIDTTEGKKHFGLLADECLDKKVPADYNQAIMDFGALQCTPANPICPDCPFVSACVAYEQNTVSQLPVKLKKVTVRHRYFNYLLMRKEDLICVTRRNRKDIWQGLYQLPLIESDGPLNRASLLQLISDQFAVSIASNNAIKKVASKEQRLSHQLIHGYLFEISPTVNVPSGEWKPLATVQKLGLPKIVGDFIDELQ